MRNLNSLPPSLSQLFVIILQRGTIQQLNPSRWFVIVGKCKPFWLEMRHLFDHTGKHLVVLTPKATFDTIGFGQGLILGDLREKPVDRLLDRWSHKFPAQR